MKAMRSRCLYRKIDSVFFAHVADDAMFRTLYEVEYVLDFVAHGDLLGNFDDSVFKAEVGRVNDAVRVGDVAQYAFGGIEMLQNNGVEAVVAGGITTEYNIRRYIFLYAAATLHEREAAYVDALLDDGTTALDGVVIYFTLAGYADTDADNTIIMDDDVVADVHLVHEEVVVTNGCGTVGMDAAGYDYVFADTVVIANDNVGGGTFYEVEVLRRCADNGILVDDVATTHGRTFKDTGMGHDNAVVTDTYALFDVSKRFDLHIIAKLGCGVYVS